MGWGRVYNRSSNNMDAEKEEELISGELQTVKKIIWAAIIVLFVVQYGFDAMARPVPEKFIYALLASALGLDQLVGKKK
jgi:hypothetical protein